MQKVIKRPFEARRYDAIEHISDAILGRKIPSLQPKRFYLSKHWRLERLQVAIQPTVCWPEMLKALNRERVLWMIRVSEVSCSWRMATNDWLTEFIIPMRKRNMIECIKYRDVFFLNSQKIIHATCLERRCCEIIQTKLKDTSEPATVPGASVLKYKKTSVAVMVFSKNPVRSAIALQTQF